jgi:hypothetical protein
MVKTNLKGKFKVTKYSLQATKVDLFLL